MSMCELTKYPKWIDYMTIHARRRGDGVRPAPPALRRLLRPAIDPDPRDAGAAIADWFDNSW
eukprot:1735580-Pleurochrysis_carterae.AAC.2